MRDPSPSPETVNTHVGPRACLFGAAGDTQNLGVSALHEATIQGLLQRLPTAHISVFDHGRGKRPASVGPTDSPLAYDLVGAYPSRRLYRPESWANIRAALLLPGTWNPAAKAIRSAQAILDISGGDSFSDLYGPARFRTVAAPKQAALAARVPLILLPQTYGPFQDPAVRARAAALVRGADSAWARDIDSFDRLRELLGDDFDPDRHRAGVDVAFALEPQPPGEPWPQPLAGWLEESRGRPVVGLNVSGLVYFTDDAARRFGITLDYRALMQRLVDRFLDRTDARIVLIAHVLGHGGLESDEDANDELRARASEHADRVTLAPVTVTAAQIKALIGRLDWFCGTRMHACIAALSSGVPTAGVAYSLKTRGVFESVRQQDEVVDARACETDDALERLWAAWEGRDGTVRALAASLPAVREAAARQMDAIADRLTELAAPLSAS